MATGGPDSWALDVQWDGTTWTDESPYLAADRWGQVVEIVRGGAGWEPAPSVLAGAFVDHVRHVPDNPLSPLWPNVRDGALTRFSVTKNGTTWSRHRGELSTSAPQITDGDVSTCRVGFESVDTLGRMAGVVLRSEFVERWRATSRTRTVGIWSPLSGGAASPSDSDNLGSSQDRLRVVRARGGLGTIAVVEPDGVLLSGAWELARNDASGRGPVLVASTDSAAAPLDEVVVPFRAGGRVPSGGGSRWLVQGLAGSGAEEWSLRLVDISGVTELRLYDRAGGFATLDSAWAPATDSLLGDDQWYAIRLWYTGPTASNWSLSRLIDRETVSQGSSAGYNVRATARVVVGGNLAGRSVGSQVSCASMQVGAIVASRGGLSGHVGYLDPRGGESTLERFTSIASYAQLTAYGSGAGARNDAVAITDLSGRTALDALSELARTTGVVIDSPSTADEGVRIAPADIVRDSAVALTVDLEGAAGADITRTRTVTPSRVTARYPGGEAIWAAPGRVRVDESIDTCGTTALQATNAGAWLAASSERLAVTSVTVDLAGASTDIWASMMALRIGDRVRLQVGQASVGGATPPAVQHFGQTYVDVWVTGWTERYGEGLAEMILVTAPADDPIEGEWGSALRGRWAASEGSMTVTGGTALGGVGASGTLVVAISGGAPGWTTDAAEYPLVVDWNGELRTVTSAPGAVSGGTQTLTLAAGAVAPSVARLHVSGESIDVALPASWAI